MTVFAFLDLLINRRQGAFTAFYLQTLCMFLGMSLCLLPHHVNRRWLNQPQVNRESENFKVIVFLPAALLDLISTCIQFFALYLTYASSYQMLLGSLMIFTGVLSTTFLNSVISWRKWSGILVSCSGLVVVGVSNFVHSRADANLDTNAIIAGDLLIVISRVFSAMQLVYEEKFIKKYNVEPLNAAGLEGVFGFALMAALLVVFYFIPGFSTNNPDNRLENTIEALNQLMDNKNILIGLLIYIPSAMLLNFSALACTKELNSTTRVIFANIRIIIVWIASLAFKWESFQWLQLLGFSLLIIGTCVYNDLLSCCFKNTTQQPNSETIDENTGLLNRNENNSNE